MAEKYVVPKLMGGLGNQLHMISAAMDVAIRTNRTLIFNYISHNPHSSESRSLCDLFPHVPIRSDIQVVNDYPGETFTYKDIVPHINHDETCISISGYNQHPKYIPEGFCRFLDTIPEQHPYVNMSDTAFVHFRRKDYVGHPLYEINMDVYYTTAVKRLLSMNPNVKLLVISDDTAWSNHYITNLLSGIINIDNILYLDREYTATESLKIMANCLGGAICANSSFSWWGAYVNRNRPIFMPNPWITLDENPNMGMFFEGVTKVFWKTGNIEPELQPQIISDTFVSVSFCGGIGNWIFMILAAIGYSEKYGKHFVISRENINYGIQEHEKDLLDKILRIFPNLYIVDSVPNLLTITEIEHFKYFPLEYYNSNIMLRGYFQNERYFPSEWLIPTIKTSYYPNTYFIHIRAGDYIGHDKFDIGLIEYYKNCFNILDSNINYIVFSNDNTYADNYMKQFGIRYTVSHITDQVDVLIEMANCAGGICANSSFSWLGGLFQGETRGHIFMPSTWIKGEDCSSVYPRWATIIDIYSYSMPCKIYDIFIKNKSIYLISTHLSLSDVNVIVTVNDITLSEFSKKEYEPLRYFYGHLSDSNIITIKLNDIIYKILNIENIEHIEPLENKHKVAFATLFKDDYSFINNTVNHYRKQGVDYFYFYYNGSTLPDGLFQGSDIIYKTWNIQPYMYINCAPNFVHNAQTAFLTMFHLKYFDDNEYVILGDLDEIIIPYNSNLRLLDKVISLNKDVIKVKNHWANLNENIITYSSLASDNLHRSKCIYKGSYTKAIGIHGPKDGIIHDSTDLRMLHINNILHPERIHEMSEPLETYIL